LQGRWLTDGVSGKGGGGWRSPKREKSPKSRAEPEGRRSPPLSAGRFVGLVFSFQVFRNGGTMNCENCGLHIKRGELRLFRERDGRTGVTIRKWWLCRDCFRFLTGIDAPIVIELLSEDEECGKS